MKKRNYLVMRNVFFFLSKEGQLNCPDLRNRLEFHFEFKVKHMTNFKLPFSLLLLGFKDFFLELIFAFLFYSVLCVCFHWIQVLHSTGSDMNLVFLSSSFSFAKCSPIFFFEIKIIHNFLLRYTRPHYLLPFGNDTIILCF